MQQFLYGHASGNDTADIVRRCLEQIGDIPDEASLGFIYATDRLSAELSHILELVQAVAPAVHWLGSTGMGVASTCREYYDEPALAIMLTDIPEAEFQFIANTEEMFPAISPELAAWCDSHESCRGLLHAEPTYVGVSYFLDKLLEHTPTSFIQGGLSSADGTSRQVADGVFDDGVSGVLFSANVSMVTGHTQGCSPIGPVHRIDEADQNLVLSLDKRPALEVLKEDVGEILSRDLQRLGGYIFVGLPIEGSHRDDYQVRALMGLDQEQQLLSVGDYMEGRDKLLFCRRDGNTAREDMLRMLYRMRAQLDGRPIRGGIYISCVGRGRNMFGDDSCEMQMITEELGEFPLVGFFAYGEMYRNRLYSQTGVLLLFL